MECVDYSNSNINLHARHTYNRKLFLEIQFSELGIYFNNNSNNNNNNTLSESVLYGNITLLVVRAFY